MWQRPTYRTWDGERIDGAWTHLWLRRLSGPALIDLFAYADGAVVWDGVLGDLDRLAAALDSGDLLLRDPDAPPFTPPTPRWNARYPEPLTPASFLGEVRDEIEDLNRRPTSRRRCWDAALDYQADPTEENRRALRDAYLAVPAHNRVYVLGDMDRQDIPLRVLTTDLGSPVCGDGPVATKDMHRRMLEYLRDAAAGVQRSRAAHDLREQDGPVAGPATVLASVVYPGGWPDEPGDHLLRNDHPAPFVHRGVGYPTVVHAYWALAAADPADHDRVRAAATPRQARDLGVRAAQRAGWTTVRTAVMADLLRAKFAQHPRAAEVLLATGDAALSYTGHTESAFWESRGPGEGRNWIGRLLELIRAELALAREERRT